MRAYQFIFEYRRDKTAEALADKLIFALQHSKSAFIQDSLQGPRTLLGMIRSPKIYPEKPILMSIFGKMTKLDPTQPEELEKLYQSLKPAIVDEILKIIESYDPTQNKQYTQWLARVWANSAGNLKFEDMGRMNYLHDYHIAKQKGLIPADKADINRFKNYYEWERWFHDSGISQKIQDLETEQKLAQGKANKVYEDDNVTVIIPEDEAAACRYGRGTRWCTAATTGVNYFDRYNRDGSLYILIPKNPQYEGEKYQLHFPSDQFMNEEDDPVSLDEIIENRFPELSSFFFEREPEYFENNIYYASDETLSELAKVIGEAVAEIGYNLYNELESNDDSYYEWVREESENRGYLDNDGDIDWDKVQKDSDLSYNEYNDEARKLLRTIEEVKNISPNALRAYIREYNEPEVDGASYQVLEIIYPKIIYYERNSDYDKDFADAVKNDLFIRLHIQNFRNMLRNMQEIGKVGDWTIGIRT